MWQKRLVVFVTFLMLFAFLAYGATISVGPKIGGGGGGTTIPASTPVPGQAIAGFGSNVSSPTRTDIQAPLPTATPAANTVVRGWNGTSFVSSQLDYSELANTPPLGTASEKNEDYFLLATQLGAPEGPAPLDINSLLPVANLPPSVILTTGTNTAAAASVYDLSGAATFKAPTEAGAKTPVIAGLYFDSADTCSGLTNGAWHYGDATPADVSICPFGAGSGTSVSGNLISTASNTDNFIATDTLTSGTGHPGHMTTNASGSLCWSDGTATPAAHCISASSGGVANSASKDLGTQEKCRVVENLAAADDNMYMGSFAVASTITSIWCSCKGTCSSLATFTLHHGAVGGQAMTITGTNPTCSPQGTTPTPANVTANNSLDAYEDFSFDETNASLTTGDTYMICVSFVRN